MSADITDEEDDQPPPWSADQIAKTIQRHRQYLVDVTQQRCGDEVLARWAVTDAVGRLFIKHAQTPLSFTSAPPVLAWVVQGARFSLLKEQHRQMRTPFLDEATERRSAVPDPEQQFFRAYLVTPDIPVTVRDFGKVLAQLSIRERLLIGIEKAVNPVDSTLRSQRCRLRKKCRHLFEVADLVPARPISRRAQKNTPKK